MLYVGKEKKGYTMATVNHSQFLFCIKLYHVSTIIIIVKFTCKTRFDDDPIKIFNDNLQNRYIPGITSINVYKD